MDGSGLDTERTSDVGVVMTFFQQAERGTGPCGAGLQPTLDRDRELAGRQHVLGRDCLSLIRRAGERVEDRAFSSGPRDEIARAIADGAMQVVPDRCADRQTAPMRPEMREHVLYDVFGQVGRNVSPGIPDEPVSVCLKEDGQRGIVAVHECFEYLPLVGGLSSRLSHRCYPHTKVALHTTLAINRRSLRCGDDSDRDAGYNTWL
jgi:hypothetical protein